MNTTKISHRKHLTLVKDYTRSAMEANLVYVTDKEAGISRIKKGKGFAYALNNAPVKTKEEVNRIRKLAIPPAWTKVWICTKENGHIQATGFDIRELMSLLSVIS